MNSITRTFEFGGKTLTFETGEIARQASASVIVRMQDTVVMVNVVGSEEFDEGKDFFPLRVDYQEKSYAAGKIPGGFFKREGRPSEREILTARMIDRAIRPLFSKAFTNEVQVIASVLSLDPEIDPDILAMLGTSCALALSGIPYAHPMAAARVGYVNGKYCLNPSSKQLESSALNLVVAGTDESVVMVESEASELSEEVMLGAVMHGHEHFQPVIQAIRELCREAGKTTWELPPQADTTALNQLVREKAKDALLEAYATTDKLARQAKLKAIREETKIAVFEAQSDEAKTQDPYLEHKIKGLIHDLESELVRSNILEGKRRIDGRDLTTVRPIYSRVGLLPRVHGSALFTRGETQAIATVTLGSGKDAQLIDGLMGESKEKFMLHYNFPPYCVGEIGMVGSPKRREIGHGRLAKRGLQAVLPSEEEFPYVIRAVSEITESNGSSSQASICGICLALMDAGVPVKAPVAGIAMGLIKEGEQYAVLSDILGDEDHLGDMDFKVAGTQKGITALQMDIKITGITKEIMDKALEQAKHGRLHILNCMGEAISAPKSSMSKFAPQIVSMRIKPDKVRDVIGKGGATIRQLIEETGAEIDLSDDGTVVIAAQGEEAANKAKQRIELLTAEVEAGQIYEGKVVRLAEFGAFVNLLPGKDGLVHVSQISHQRIKDVQDVLSEGDMVRVKVLEIDRQGRVRLSMKVLVEEPQTEKVTKENTDESVN